MKKAILIIMVLLVTFPACAEQVYVRADAIIEKKQESEGFSVTVAMKNAVLALSEITVSNVMQAIAPYCDASQEQAKQVIEALVADQLIVTKEKRYKELYPIKETVGVEVNFTP